MVQTISKMTMSVGILAVLTGLFAAVAIRPYLEQQPEATPEAVKEPAKPHVMKVPLAAVDLPADRVVNGTDMMQMSMTEKQLVERFKVNPEQVIIGPRGILNRYLLKPVKRGQPFLTSDFYLEGTGPSVAKKLQPGFRAIRVQVPQTREAGVQTGMFVDVFFRAEARPARAGQPAVPERTVTLLRHIEVIDAERPISPHAKGANAADAAKKKPLLFTLAVPEAKADMFGVIEGRGELWLTPTPAADKGTANGADATGINAETLVELLGIKPPSPPPAPFETAIYTRGQLKINRFMNGKLVANHSSYHDGARDGGKAAEVTFGDDRAAAPKESPNTEAPTAPPAPGNP